MCYINNYSITFSNNSQLKVLKLNLNLLMMGTNYNPYLGVGRGGLKKGL